MTTSTSTSTELLVRECVKHSLNLPLADGCKFLNALLTTVGDCREVYGLRHAYINLHAASEQLESIATGQPNLL